MTENCTQWTTPRPTPSSGKTRLKAADDASGNPDIDHAYQKPAGGLGSGQGTVYAVCGCSGEGGLTTVPLHSAMYTAFGGYGSMVLDVDGSTLEARMINNSGIVRDLFVLEKGIPGAAQLPALDLRRTATGLELSWPTSALDYELENTAADVSPWGWQAYPDVPSVIGRRHVLLLDAQLGQRFFRLRADP